MNLRLRPSRWRATSFDSPTASTRSVGASGARTSGMNRLPARHPVCRGRRAAPGPPSLRRVSERDRVIRAMRTGESQVVPPGLLRARLRWTGVRGSGPAFWLFSTAHATNPDWPQPACPEPTCLSAEIDVFEVRKPPRRLHRNHPPQLMQLLRRTESDEREQLAAAARHELSGWHVYAARWTSTSDPGISTTASSCPPPCTTRPTSRCLLFDNWNTPWLPERNKRGDPARAHTEVDWVRVWQN